MTAGSDSSIPGKRCLITGVAGFIGSHLAEELLRRGHSIRGLDRLSDYYDVDIKLRNLARIEKTGDIDFIKADLAECDLSEPLQDIDIVFHLAAQAGVRVSWGPDFEVYLRDNVLATQRLLEALRGTEVERCVLASSSSVYGDAETLPVVERERLRPRSPYGVTKEAVEKLSSAYFAQFGVPTVGLRYFTVYGPGQRPDMAFNRFISGALSGAPLVIYGDGSQRRDFTFVSDTVEATISAGWCGRPGEFYNVAGGSQASITEVVGELQVILGNELSVEYDSVMPGDVKETRASTEKARRDLRYAPTVPLLDGLRSQVEWQQDDAVMQVKRS